MANAVHNPRRSAKYPAKFNQRENRASTHNYSMAVIDSALALKSDDGISFVRATAAATATLPPAAENKGRTICFLQSAAATLTVAQNADGADIDGADADFTSLDAADDWAEFFCTGSEWLIVKQHIA